MQTYQPVELSSLFSSFHRHRLTGTVCCQPSQGTEIKQQYYILFKFGEITYGGSELPTIESLLELLKNSLNHPLLKMVLQMARNRAENPNDWAEIIDKAVSTRVISWDQVEQVLQAQTISFLKQTMQGPGLITHNPDISVEISFGADRHCLPWDILHQTLAPEALTPPQTTTVFPSSKPVKKTVELAQVNSPSALRAQSNRSENHSSGFTVLSVDDSPIVQKMIQRALRQECHVVLADNALSALKILNSDDDIALVLLDVNMPGINGLEFCRTVRSIPKFKNLPVIMLTANEGNLNKLKGQIAGSTLYLTKPIEDQKLIQIVRQYSGTEEPIGTSNRPIFGDNPQISYSPT